jgi:hypothetical protein
MADAFTLEQDSSTEQHLVLVWDQKHQRLYVDLLDQHLVLVRLELQQAQTTRYYSGLQPVQAHHRRKETHTYSWLDRVLGTDPGLHQRNSREGIYAEQLALVLEHLLLQRNLLQSEPHLDLELGLQQQGVTYLTPEQLAHLELEQLHQHPRNYCLGMQVDLGLGLLAVR